MDGMKKVSRGVSAHFINDIDPYLGSASLPAPMAVDLSADYTWEDFQDTSPSLHPDFAVTQPSGFQMDMSR